MNYMSMKHAGCNGCLALTGHAADFKVCGRGGRSAGAGPARQAGPERRLQLPEAGQPAAWLLPLARQCTASGDNPLLPESAATITNCQSVAADGASSRQQTCMAHLSRTIAAHSAFLKFYMADIQQCLRLTLLYCGLRPGILRLGFLKEPRPLLKPRHPQACSREFVRLTMHCVAWSVCMAPRTLRAVLDQLVAQMLDIKMPTAPGYRMGLNLRRTGFYIDRQMTQMQGLPLTRMSLRDSMQRRL